MIFGVKVSPRRGMLFGVTAKARRFSGESPLVRTQNGVIRQWTPSPRPYNRGGGVAAAAVATVAAVAAIKGHFLVVAPFSMGRRRGKTRYTLPPPPWGRTVTIRKWGVSSWFI